MSKALYGKQVVTMKAEKPVAPLTPVAMPPAGRKIGTAKGDFKTPDSFDAPLPDHVLDEFEA
jgi:antitoxin (DNA-binding transcriptional repressor) of toxin-antitoxin stability system